MKRYNLLIIVDAEGCTGIKEWKDVVINYYTDSPTEKVREAMAKDVNAVIEGISKFDRAGKVVILDSHARGKNIRKEDINFFGMDVTLKSWSIKNFKKYSGISDFGILVGAHGKFGSSDGKPPMYKSEFEDGKKTGLSHFNMFGVKNAFLNSRSIGESISFIMLLKEMKVPLVYCCGSKAAIDELNRFAYEIKTSITKNGRRTYNKDKVRKNITKSTISALKDAAKGKGFIGLDDKRLKYVSFSLEFKNPGDKNADKKVKKQLKKFNTLHKINYVRLEGRKVFFFGKGKTPYFNDYKLINEA